MTIVSPFLRAARFKLLPFVFFHFRVRKEAHYRGITIQRSSKQVGVFLPSAGFLGRKTSQAKEYINSGYGAYGVGASCPISIIESCSLPEADNSISFPGMENVTRTMVSLVTSTNIS